MPEPQIHSMRPPIPRGVAVPLKGPPPKRTPAEAMLWLEHFMAAADRSPNLPISIAVDRNSDGTLTITARPA
jgi:hypothetical protein